MLSLPKMGLFLLEHSHHQYDITMRHLYPFLSVLFLIISFQTIAQTPVLFKHSELKTYVVHFEQANRNDIANYIIRELARGNNKRLERTEYSYKFMYDVQLTRRGNKLITHVDVKNFRLQGDTRYMGFDVSDVLIPNQMEFVARLEQGGKTIAELTQKPVQINGEKNRFTIEYADTLKNDQNLKLVIPEFIFQFTSRNRTAFTHKISLIDEYFGSDLTMQNIYGLLQSLDMYQLERIRENQNHLQQTHHLITQIHSRDFFNSLNLREYDPIAMMPKMNDIMALHSEQSRHMAYVVENLHVLYYERGLEAASVNAQQARELFRASVQANNAFAPAHLELSRSFYQENNISESVASLRRAYQIPRRDEQTNRGLTQLARDIESHYINQAVESERRNRHQEALQAWEAALDFCQSLPSFNCREQVRTGIARAHTNIFNGIFDQADRQNRQGNLIQAEQLVMQAIDYQKKNSSYVVSSDNAQNLLSDIKTKQYRNLIDQGKRELNQKSFSNALNTFEQAQQIERSFRISVDPQLTALIRQSKRPLILVELESANAAVERNQLQQARSLLENVVTDVNHYDFKADPEITSRLENIRGQLQSQHCTNIQNLLDQLLNLANNRILEGNFMGAETHFEEIRYHQSLNLSCGLSIQNMERRRAEVLPAIIYQQTIDEAKQQVHARRYIQAVDLYNQASMQYMQQGVEKFRLTHMLLHEFSKSFHPDFINHVAGYLAHKGEGQHALELLQLLDTKRFPAKQMRQAQEMTGVVLGRLDAEINPGLKPKFKVPEYTNNSKNLKYLRSAYIKQYKRTAKNAVK
jgi:tetratricopeptide (TPR) repeat protein